eukprot:6172466-Pleurochrysis_carterae.AAC.4
MRHVQGFRASLRPNAFALFYPSRRQQPSHMTDTDSSQSVLGRGSRSGSHAGTDSGHVKISQPVPRAVTGVLAGLRPRIARLAVDSGVRVLSSNMLNTAYGSPELFSCRHAIASKRLMSLDHCISSQS